MKIIYCANARIPTQKAHGFQISKMCEQLGLAGAKVELWHTSRKNPITDDVFAYYNLQKSFSVREISLFDFVSLASLLGPLAMWLQRLAFYIRLKKIFKNEKAAIFSRDPEVIYAAKRAGLFTLYENHDGLSKHPRMQLSLIADTDRIITTNEHIRRQFVDHGIDETVITVLPHGVDFTAFDVESTKEQAIKDLDLSVETTEALLAQDVLVYTGNFTTMNQDKGITDIMQSMKSLPENFYFAAIGGNDRDIKTYTELSKSLGIENRVLFVGRQSQTQLGLWQKVASILLMPFPDTGHYREHMAPLKMFEYLVSKRPIIASDLPSIKAVLSDKVAYFCQPSNPNDLSRVIKKVHNADTSTITAAAYTKAGEYRWDKRANKIISLVKI
ncbi:MAG: glycosyltransferase [Patescibacteria group bacterium]